MSENFLFRMKEVTSSDRLMEKYSLFWALLVNLSMCKRATDKEQRNQQPGEVCDVLSGICPIVIRKEILRLYRGPSGA